MPVLGPLANDNGTPQVGRARAPSRCCRAYRSERAGELETARVVDYFRMAPRVRCNDMGQSSRHVASARVPGRMGVETACGVYCYDGDWRKVLFGIEDSKNESPLDGAFLEREKG